jgi:hypothetical protein
VSAAEPQWSGAGKVRIIVEVPPVDLKDRKSDQLVASYAIDFDKVLADQKIAGSADLSTLQVQRIDASGKPIAFPKFDSSQSEFDCPARFDDDTLPEKVPRQRRPRRADEDWPTRRDRHPQAQGATVQPRSPSQDRQGRVDARAGRQCPDALCDLL